MHKSTIQKRFKHSKNSQTLKTVNLSKRFWTKEQKDIYPYDVAEYHEVNRPIYSQKSLRSTIRSVRLKDNNFSPHPFVHPIQTRTIAITVSVRHGSYLPPPPPPPHGTCYIVGKAGFQCPHCWAYTASLYPPMHPPPPPAPPVPVPHPHAVPTPPPLCAWQQLLFSPFRIH